MSVSGILIATQVFLFFFLPELAEIFWSMYCIFLVVAPRYREKTLSYHLYYSVQFWCSVYLKNNIFLYRLSHFFNLRELFQYSTEYWNNVLGLNLLQIRH